MDQKSVGLIVAGLALGYTFPKIVSLFSVKNGIQIIQQNQDALWKQLQEQFTNELQNTHLKILLQNQKRNSQLLFNFNNDIYLDLSHEKINNETIDLLHQFAQNAQLFGKIQDMFQGVIKFHLPNQKKINITENRAVLHCALRITEQNPPKIIVDGQDVVQQVQEVLGRIQKFTTQVRNQNIVGYTNKPLVNYVVIGIGGSYLAVEFVYEALRSNKDLKDKIHGRRLKFLANVDPIDFSRAVEGLNVEETLFIINSKTFTTAETMLNARTCKDWVLKQYENKIFSEESKLAVVNAHMCAVSTNLQETGKFGISQEKVFGFWDWVGGRYSVCSAVGVLPLSLFFGFETIELFLKGARSIDKCFLEEKDIRKNLPVLLGLIGFHLTTIQKNTARAILPYCQAQRLCKFVPHIQQLDMESNGKRVNVHGAMLDYEAGVVNFGEPGTNGQHSFYQLLHQGRTIPCEFIGFVKSQNPVQLKGEQVSNHDELMSNFFSQPDALAVGKNHEQLQAEKVPLELQNHKFFPGDKPSLSILFKNELNPYTCGQLLALYEGRTVVEGFLWDVNSFDQWGVELGKVLAKNVRNVFQSKDNLQKGNFNSATQKLLEIYLQK